MTGHCIACVNETEPETPGQEESSTSQIRKQEEKEVLIMKNESKEEETDAQNRDVGLEDTEENFGDEEIDFKILITHLLIANPQLMNPNSQWKLSLKT